MTSVMAAAPLSRLARLGLGAAACALAAAAGAAAQTEPAQTPTGMSELVVTAPHYVPSGEMAATKTAMPLLETPQSVTVITRDQIDVLNWQSTQAAVRYTAGVFGENFGPDQRYDYVTVRGFYPVEYIDGLQAPIAPQSSLNDIGVDLWGFDSIQIIKGPASYLYGESPPGGMLDLTSRRPQDAFHGEMLGEYGSYHEGEVAGDVTGPIAPGLDGRLTALWRDEDTQVQFENHRRFYVAPALTWHIDPSTELTFLSFYQYDRDRGCCGGFLPAQGTLLPNPNGVIPTSLNLGEPGYNLYVRDEAAIGYEFRHAFNASWSFVQNFKYFYFKDNTTELYGAGLESDLQTEDRYNFEYPEDIKEFAVDSRIEGHVTTGPVSQTLLFGYDYRNYANVTQFGFALAPSLNVFNPVYGAAIAQPPLSPYISQHQLQSGVYFQDAVKWNRFVLTLGGREDWLDTHSSGSLVSNTKFTYRVGLDYVLANGVAPYISYATSFEPTPGADFEGQPFAPSTGTQVEGGVKFQPTFLPKGANVLVTAAGYHIIQDNVLTPDTNPAHPFASIQTGQVQVTGFELEGVARIYDRITINGSYTYTDSRVTQGTAYVGNQLYETPWDKFSLFADYTQQTGVLAGLGGGLGGRFLGASYGDQANQWRNPPTTLFDAIVHYDIHHWRVAINADNLLDKVYVARCTSIDECFYGARRTILASLSRKW